MTKKLKVLEICPFSAGGCGVWARVKQESVELVKRGYGVRVFSSDFEKGTDRIMPKEDIIKGFVVKRFPAKKLGGESFMSWHFEKEALEYCPDVIIAHNYRHLHTTKALKVARILRKSGRKCKVFLVTHAPFVEGDITRSFVSKWIVRFYDWFVGPLTLSKFDRVLVISHWEIPYLLKMGLKRDKIVYIPNGIPDLFFTQKKFKEKNKILFLGRVAPKKKIETLISAIPYLNNKKIKVEVVGPEEKEYADALRRLIVELNVKDRITFSEPVYDAVAKIRKIDSAKVFVLPSRVEGMPQSLIEAMAREKVVIGSDSIAIRDLIKDEVNGCLFEFNNPKSLARKIDISLGNANKKMKKNARKSVEMFKWSRIIEKIEHLIR